MWALPLLFSLAAPALDPSGIAQSYAQDGAPREPRLSLWQPGGAPPAPPPDLTPEPTLADLLLEVSRPAPPLRDGEAPLLDSLIYEGQTGILARLVGLQAKLFVNLGTYDTERDTSSTVRQGHFAGLSEATPRGQTLNLADGAVLGDLSLSLGTADSDTTMAQVMAGEASLAQLNPFRDVRAQFDLAFASLPRGLRKRLPPPLLIVRLSAAYLDAFTKASSGSNSTGGVDTNSEVGLSAGVSW